uniref:Polycomb protein VEFS-Box domain-containing protein n=1 Tax=Plectus sambesii TaxID=2011161 RepID=A0A914UI07_9BILA
MATPVENSNRPAYRPFLMRNLSFLPKSKALGAAHKKKRNKVKKEPSPFVSLLKSPSEEEHSRTASVQFHSFRDKELPGSRKACVELYLRTVTGKARDLIRLPSAKFSISVNAPELMTTIDLPRDVGTPCRNGTISRSYYLVVHTVVSEQQDAISSGGRSLRNVPSRQAIMADRNGLRSHKAKERRSDEKKQQLELFGILLLADATRETSGLIERTVAIPLVEHRAKEWRTSVDFPEQILELSKKTKTGPFMRVTVTREADDSDSDESEDSRSVKSTSHISSSSASVASIKGSALEGALRDASIPGRLLYRWIQGFKELTDNVVSPRDELEGFTTEPPHTDRCIFCGYRFSDLYSLLKHMRLNYPRFEFVYNKATAQVYLPTVDVHVKRNFDGRYEGNPIRQFRNGMLSGPTKYAVNSHMEVIISNKCEARFKRKQSQQRDLVEFSRPTEKLVNRLTRSLNGHVRTYFNARTRQPLPAPPSKPTPVLTDPDWLKSAIARKMDEFSDLNNGEKQLMVMWNVFLAKKEHRCIGDCMLMRALCKFIDAHGKQIVSKHLLGNFFCHLANLEEQGLITGEQISTLVSMITQI